MNLTMPTTFAGRAAVVIAALAAALVADLATGASWPGRISVFALASSVVLVIGAKSLVSPIVSRPAGSRVGELGDPRDDLVREDLAGDDRDGGGRA